MVASGCFGFLLLVIGTLAVIGGDYPNGVSMTKARMTTWVILPTLVWLYLRLKRTVKDPRLLEAAVGKLLMVARAYTVVVIYFDQEFYGL